MHPERTQDAGRERRMWWTLCGAIVCWVFGVGRESDLLLIASLILSAICLANSAALAKISSTARAIFVVMTLVFCLAGINYSLFVVSGMRAKELMAATEQLVPQPVVSIEVEKETQSKLVKGTGNSPFVAHGGSKSWREYSYRTAVVKVEDGGWSGKASSIGCRYYILFYDSQNEEFDFGGNIIGTCTRDDRRCLDATTDVVATTNNWGTLGIRNGPAAVSIYPSSSTSKNVIAVTYHFGREDGTGNGEAFGSATWRCDCASHK